MACKTTAIAERREFPRIPFKATSLVIDPASAEVVVANTTELSRPEFKHMFLDASCRKFDLLLFWALDRLSREGAFKTLQHLERLESYGVGFRSYTEPYFDSCGIFKEAVVSIVATLAKQERVRLSERTKAGLAIARSKGRIIGRPRVEIQPEEVAALRSQGLSLRAIARSLGVSEGTVRRLTIVA